MKITSLSVLNIKTKKFLYINGDFKYLRPDKLTNIPSTDRVVMAAKFSNTEQILEKIENMIIHGFFGHWRNEEEKTDISDKELNSIKDFVNDAKNFKVVQYSNVSLDARVEETIKTGNFVNCNLYKELKIIANFQINQAKFNQNIAWLVNYMFEKPKKYKKYILHIKPGKDVLFSQNVIDSIKELLGKDVLFSDMIPNINTTSAWKLYNNYYVATDNISDLNLIKLSLGFNDIKSIETKNLNWFS